MRKPKLLKRKHGQRASQKERQFSAKGKTRYLVLKKGKLDGHKEVNQAPVKIMGILLYS